MSLKPVCDRPVGEERGRTIRCERPIRRLATDGDELTLNGLTAGLHLCEEHGNELDELLRDYFASAVGLYVTEDKGRGRAVRVRAFLDPQGGGRPVTAAMIRDFYQRHPQHLRGAQLGAGGPVPEDLVRDFFRLRQEGAGNAEQSRAGQR